MGCCSSVPPENKPDTIKYEQVKKMEVVKDDTDIDTDIEARGHDVTFKYEKIIKNKQEKIDLPSKCSPEHVIKEKEKEKEKEYRDIEEWFNDNIKLEENERMKYYHLFIDKGYINFEIIQIKLNDDEALNVLGIDNKLHRQEILKAIVALNDKTNVIEHDMDKMTETIIETMKDEQAVTEKLEEIKVDERMSGKIEEYVTEQINVEEPRMDDVILMNNDNNDNEKEIKEDMIEEKEEEDIIVNVSGSVVMGNIYEDTKDFDDTQYLTQIINDKQINLSMIHLNKIIFCKSDTLLNGIRCEWCLYDDNGQIIQRFKSEGDDRKIMDVDECIMKFGDYIYDPITINNDKYINSLSMTTNINGEINKMVFGGHGGSTQNISIPSGNIVIGFHGGYSECIHNLGIISIPYKQSVGYNLIKRFFNRYHGELSNNIITNILHFVFCLDDEQIDEDITLQKLQKDRKATEDTKEESMNNDAERGDINNVEPVITEYGDIEDEHIENLLNMKLAKYLTNPYLLGETNKYKLPKKKRAYNQIEKDLKRIYEGLLDADSEDRKYCKLVLLKYYEVLSATFNRYCLIGGDGDWLTQKGWNNLYKDMYIVDKKSEICNDTQCKQLFTRIIKIHDNKRHCKNMESDWNGIWKKEKNDGDKDDDDDESQIIYKLKLMSDYKLKGFIGDFSYCHIDGNLKYNDNTKTKTFNMVFNDGPYKNKRFKCNVRLIDKERIEIEQISDNDGDENKQFILKKIDELNCNDDKIFKSVYGLLRYEFFDSLLVLSQMKFAKSTHKNKYTSFLKFIQDFIVQFIWDEMDINDSCDGFKWLLKKDGPILLKLFNLYSNDDQKLSKKKWEKLCKNIFAKGAEPDAFKKGGKPTKADMMQSYDLAKNSGYSKMLNYNEFEKALQNLAHKMYKKKPKSKYVKINYDDRFKKLLSWAVKLQKSGHKP